MLLIGCLDPLDSETNADGETKIVISGRITTAPPPYTVEISKSTVYQDGLNASPCVPGATVMLYNSEGASEILTETACGIYKTDSSGMQGETGQSYYISVELPDGRSFTSNPETIVEVPEIQDIRYRFESENIINEADNIVEIDGFRIYADYQDPAGDNYYQWKWKMIHEIYAYPERRTRPQPDGTSIPDPPECSGYTRDFSGGIGAPIAFKPTYKCECCECWVTTNSRSLNVLDDRLFEGSFVQDNLVTFIEIDERFYTKIYVEVELHSLSLSSYDFWNRVQTQLNNTGTLFDSPPGNIQGNIYNDDPAGQQVLGYFTASDVSKTGVFISREEIPYAINTEYEINDSCTIVKNSTNIKPDIWD